LNDYNFRKNKVEIKHENIIKILEVNKSSTIDLGDKTWCIYELPNGHVLTSNYYSLSIYNEIFKLVKKIDIVETKTFYCNDLVINRLLNSIYFGDHQNNRVIKLDLGLNFIKCLNDKAYLPHGIEYYNENIYVCDSLHQAILKFNQNLDFVEMFKIDYQPFQIKITGKTAMVRPIQINTINSIHFYEADTFKHKFKYDGHKGTISVVGSYFYEFNYLNKIMYCYNDNGILTDEIVIKIDELKKCRFNGALVFFDNKLVIASDDPKKLHLFSNN
jgi:hypothetical protein